MGEVRLSDAAEQDLADIWFRIAGDRGAGAADKWIDRIEERCRQFAKFPRSGPARPDVGPHVRVLAISRWLVLYRIIPDGVRINRVIDAARDLGSVESSDD